MSGYILEGTIEQPLASDVFYQLSKIAYEENLQVKSVAVSKGKAVKEIRINASGRPDAVQTALAATQRCISQLPAGKIALRSLCGE